METNATRDALDRDAPCARRAYAFPPSTSSSNRIAKTLRWIRRRLQQTTRANASIPHAPPETRRSRTKRVRRRAIVDEMFARVALERLSALVRDDGVERRPPDHRGGASVSTRRPRPDLVSRPRVRQHRPSGRSTARFHDPHARRAVPDHAVDDVRAHVDGFRAAHDVARVRRLYLERERFTALERESTRLHETTRRSTLDVVARAMTTARPRVSTASISIVTRRRFRRRRATRDARRRATTRRTREIKIPASNGSALDRAGRGRRRTDARSRRIARRCRRDRRTSSS